MPFQKENMPSQPGNPDSSIAPKLGKTFGLNPENESVKSVKPVNLIDFALRGAGESEKEASRETVPESKFKNGYLRADKLSHQIRHDPVLFGKFHLDAEKREKLIDHLHDKFAKNGKFSQRDLQKALSESRLKYRDIPEGFGSGTRAKENYKKVLGHVFGLDTFKK